MISATAGLDFYALANTSGDYEYELFEDGTVEITDYTGSATELVIPSTINGYPVISIGFYAFSNGEFKNVTIPENIEYIRACAFDSCKNLETITIPKNVSNISWDAFMCCTSLMSINVDTQNSYYSSENGVLFNKNKTILIQYPIGNKQASYKIAKNVVTVGYLAFFNCLNLSNINVDDKNNYYSSKDGVLFNKDATKLIQYPVGNVRTSYTIPNNVIELGYEAFNSSNNLTSVYISDSVEDMHYNSGWGGGPEYPKALHAFYNCKSLEDITVSVNNKYFASVDGVLFNKDKTAILDYPAANKNSSYIIPNSVVCITQTAFKDCTNLFSLKIPYSVNEIDFASFYDSSIADIEVDAFNEYFSSLDGILFNKDKTKLIACPPQSIKTLYVVPKNVKIIESGAFENCVNLTGIRISQSVESIGWSVFGNCENLEYITVLNKNCDIPYGDYTIPKTITIYGYNNSTAQEYSEKYNCIFIALETHSHAWNSPDITKNATCTSTGVKMYTCTICGETKSETISALGHSFGNSTSCSVCGVGNLNYVAPQPTTPTQPTPTAPITTEKAPSGATKVNGEWVAKKQKNTKIKKLTNAKKSLKISWSKVSGVTGYQIQYSTTSKFTKKTTKSLTIKKNKTTSATVKKLKAKKKYYVRVRTYKNVKLNGKTVKVYSSWTKAKTIKTK